MMEQGGTLEFGVTRLSDGRVRVRHGGLVTEYGPGEVVFRRSDAGLQEMVLPSSEVLA